MAPSTSKELARIKDALIAEAKALGFEAVGVVSAEPDPKTMAGLQSYLDAGHHGAMAWMKDRQHHRESPQGLWPEARTVIMLGANYGPDSDPLLSLGKKDRAAISVYAKNLDYHDVLKKRLKVMGRWMSDRYGCALKVFVDTAPVMEKPLAARAGLGWQGKHTNLVSRDFGSWLFLGAIMTPLDLPVDAPQMNHCGACSRCLDICPTGAFPEPYKIDARKCISYLTIEHKGPVEEALRPKLGNRIYGCDDCLSVCPWNKFASTAEEIGFQAREELDDPSLAMLLTLDDPAFRTLFRKNPIKRIGRDRFIRNCLYAAGNSGDVSLIASIEPHLSDPDPVVQDAARWAMGRLRPLS